MSRAGRRGITLVEVLVTIAIVAVLAAVLVPALAKQLSAGDAGRAATDLQAVQTAIQAFTSNVRRQPSSLPQLVDGITGGSDLHGVPYGQREIARWRGPYLAKLLVNNSLPTAFGASIQSSFSTTTAGATDYVTVSMLPLTESDFNKIDLVIDEEVSSSTGQLRYNAASSSAVYLAQPIQ